MVQNQYIIYITLYVYIKKDSFSLQSGLSKKMPVAGCNNKQHKLYHNQTSYIPPSSWVSCHEIVIHAISQSLARRSADDEHYVEGAAVEPAGHSQATMVRQRQCDGARASALAARPALATADEAAGVTRAALPLATATPRRAATEWVALPLATAARRREAKAVPRHAIPEMAPTIAPMIRASDFATTVALRTGRRLGDSAKRQQGKRSEAQGIQWTPGRRHVENGDCGS